MWNTWRALWSFDWHVAVFEVLKPWTFKICYFLPRYSLRRSRSIFYYPVSLGHVWYPSHNFFQFCTVIESLLTRNPCATCKSGPYQDSETQSSQYTTQGSVGGTANSAEEVERHRVLKGELWLYSDVALAFACWLFLRNFPSGNSIGLRRSLWTS